jgi:predicted ATPase with chaperone activity
VDIINGLPGFEIVGLPNAAVKESTERVRTAIKGRAYFIFQVIQKFFSRGLRRKDIRHSFLFFIYNGNAFLNYIFFL